MQDWAYGLLETASGPQAAKILELQVDESFVRPNACMDVAMATGAKKFLTQRHCVKLMDEHWRGGCIKQDTNMLVLLCYAVLPLFNPYLWRKTQRQKERAAAASANTRTDSVIDALGMVFRVLGDGQHSEQVHDQAMEMFNLEGGKPGEQGSGWVADLFGPKAADGIKAESKAYDMGIGKVAAFSSAPPTYEHPPPATHHLTTCYLLTYLTTYTGGGLFLHRARG